MAPGPRPRRGYERLIGEDHQRLLRAARPDLDLAAWRRSLGRYVTDAAFHAMVRELVGSGVVSVESRRVQRVDDAVQEAAVVREMLEAAYLDLLRVAPLRTGAVPWGILLAENGLRNAARLRSSIRGYIDRSFPVTSRPALQALCESASRSGRAALTAISAGLPLSQSEIEAACEGIPSREGEVLRCERIGRERFLLFTRDWAG